GAFGGGCRSTGLSALESSQIGDRAGHAWSNSDLAVLADLDADRPLEHWQDDLVALAPPARDAETPDDFVRPIGRIASRQGMQQPRMDRHGPATQLLGLPPPAPHPADIRLEA